jgi:polyadenylate-binding protein
MSYTRQSILFVSGLDKTVNENMLYQLFNDFPISYIKIAKDHSTKESFGYAFVGFKSHSRAEEAIAKLNYQKLGKKTLRISWYNREPNNFRNNPEYNVFVKKVDKNVTHKEFHDHFSQFGNIYSARLVEDDEGEVVGYGFVLYDSADSAALAIKECNNKEWKGKKLYVGQFVKNRPKKAPQYNNIYVRNIPKSWSTEDIKKYFSTYGELGSVLVKEPEPSNLEKLPEDKRNQILSHKYAFICYKNFDSAKDAVNKVPYFKLNDSGFNKEIESLSQLLSKNGVEQENIFRAASFIVENTENWKSVFNDQNALTAAVEAFKKHLKENDDTYLVKDKSDRLDCCQALKRKDRLKKLKQLYEKIKKQIKEKYRFCNLYVKNLPDNIDDETLRTLFSKFGEIRSVKTVKKELLSSYLGLKRSLKVFGFVCFFEAEKARDAKTNLHSQILPGTNAKLFVDYHQSKQERADYLKLKMMANKNFKKGGEFPGMRNLPMNPMRNFPGQVFGPHMLRKFPPQTAFMKPAMQMNIPMNPNYPMQQPNIPMNMMTPEMMMDKNARRDFYGERLYTKISSDPRFTGLSE